MSFGLYSVGFVLVIVGLIYGAHLLHVPVHWIAVGTIVLLGVGFCRVSKQLARRTHPVRASLSLIRLANACCGGKHVPEPERLEERLPLQEEVDESPQYFGSFTLS
jgi:hypothetical protein